MLRQAVNGKMLRQAVQQPVQNNSRPYTFVAPRGGWVTSQNLVQSPPGTAQVLENWRPTTTGIELRGGSRTHATINSTGVISMIAYNPTGSQELFAADETNIYNVTTVADPDVPPVPDVTGQTTGYYSYVNFVTAGGAFLTAVNGTDDALLYNGTTWVAATITGVSSSTLSHVWLYRNREFFVQQNSLSSWYLPVNSIAGAATEVALYGIFKRGGKLLFGGTWSLGQTTGLDDNCVFVTDQGEAAIYSGDPDEDTWTLVGVYDLSNPLGKRATMKAGGDLVIATEEGMVPISAAVSKDAAVISLAAISKNIEPDWRAAALDRNSLPWEIIKWPEQRYAIVSLPITSDDQLPICFVVNTETGAWCKYTGWNTQCMELLDSQLYFGTNDGKVKLAEIGGSDDGEPIYYTYVGNPDPITKNIAGVKTMHQARVTFRSSTTFNAQVNFATNYSVTVPSPPNAASDVASNEWDSGLWDVALWDQPSPAESIGTKWVSIGRSGYVFQPIIQITGALSQLPRTELVQIDSMVESGGIVV
ncbi:hypothetical protein FJV76_14275 [Mesorhizobium sp. WSM4303]|uniref:hypothetical protein n=1 Tax=Mesorhizobium sp. WSM4303 TaxID=2589887 RepID=UPI00115CDB91|nr:hypothetical protein [Mesorhizobium sp. WSM4303]TRD03800.1 hypothetical protein FJV76_14275 [Mesorhizobium sp. WSM4303]